MSDDSDQPPASKLTRSKERWAREGRFLTGKISRPEEQRLPLGQHLTKDWPTLDLGLTPKISRERWRLDVHGAVENPIFWDWKQFSAQPKDIARGPGRLAAALDIDLEQDGLDLMNAKQLWVGRDTHAVPTSGRSVRIGLTKAADKRLRFFIAGSAYLSGASSLNRTGRRA